jgi:hypothetical protein
LSEITFAESRGIAPAWAPVVLPQHTSQVAAKILCDHPNRSRLRLEVATETGDVPATLGHLTLWPGLAQLQFLLVKDRQSLASRVQLVNQSVHGSGIDPEPGYGISRLMSLFSQPLKFCFGFFQLSLSFGSRRHVAPYRARLNIDKTAYTRRISVG